MQKIKLDWIFNISDIENLKSELNNNSVVFDMSDTKIIDTEAIKFLLELSKEKNIEIENPPYVLFEILEVLQLKEFFLSKIKINHVPQST